MPTRKKPVARLDVRWGNETEHGSPCWMIRCHGSKKWETLYEWAAPKNVYHPASAGDPTLERLAFAWMTRNRIPRASYVDVRIDRASADAACCAQPGTQAMTTKLLHTPINDHTARLRPTAPPLDLDALAALDAARTPGPYIAVQPQSQEGGGIIAQTSPPGVCPGATSIRLADPSLIAGFLASAGWEKQQANAAFIVAACNALGPLLARVRAAEARVAELEAVAEERRQDDMDARYRERE